MNNILEICIGVTRPLQIKLENRKNKGMWFNLFLERYDIIKIKLLVVNSAVTEVNELKNIWIAIFRLTFLIFRKQVFDIYNLKS